jgi:hypothetical protein
VVNKSKAINSSLIIHHLSLTGYSSPSTVLKVLVFIIIVIQTFVFDDVQFDGVQTD